MLSKIHMWRLWWKWLQTDQLPRPSHREALRMTILDSVAICLLIKERDQSLLSGLILSGLADFAEDIPQIPFHYSRI